MKKGISLIVLVITIIVIIILAGAVILSISQNNPISSAKEVTFKESIKGYESELSLYIAKQYTSAIPVGSYDVTTLNLDSDNIKSVITSIKNEDKSKFKVKSGKIEYVGDNEQEKKWLEDLNISKEEKDKYNMYIDEDGQKAPIPNGFVVSTINGENRISKGLVIKEGTNGAATGINEFVWIPVDGKDVTYTNPYEIIKGDSLPEGATAEKIILQGGFYIGRYETGKEDNKAVSKKGVSVWNDIKYANSEIDLTGGMYEEAMKMYNNTYIKSGLMTNEMWNATLMWLEISGYDIYNSSTWGNHNDYNSSVTSDKQVSSAGNLTKTGFSENWKANNIYDLAGNVWESTNGRVEGIDSVIRGSGYNDYGKNHPVTDLNTIKVFKSESDVGSRICIYIL